MKYLSIIEVSLKPGHIDPEGETVKQLLNELEYEVEKVNVSKVYKIIIEAKNFEEAEIKAKEISKKILANPTKDDYIVQIEEL